MTCKPKTFIFRLDLDPGKKCSGTSLTKGTYLRGSCNLLFAVALHISNFGLSLFGLGANCQEPKTVY